MDFAVVAAAAANFAADVIAAVAVSYVVVAVVATITSVAIAKACC